MSMTIVTGAHTHLTTSYNISTSNMSYLLFQQNSFETCKFCLRYKYIIIYRLRTFILYTLGSPVLMCAPIVTHICVR